MTWTHYGRWTDDGMHVIGPRGNVIYSRPEALSHSVYKFSMPRRTVGVGVNSSKRPAVDRTASAFSELIQWAARLR